MGEDIAFQNDRISDFRGLVTLTLTLDRVVLHTIMHHSSTPTYTPNFIEIEESLCGRTDRRTLETGFIKSTRRSWYPLSLGRLGGVDLKKWKLDIFAFPNELVQ